MSHITKGYLNNLHSSLEESLHGFGKYLECDFGKIPNLEVVPEKAYSARSIVPVTYKSQNVGEIVVLLFARGDGTGAESKDYNLNELIIPQEFVHSEKPERVVPREKTNMVRELFFPLFSVFNYNKEFISRKDAVLYAACLDELGVSGNEVVSLGKLGSNDSAYDVLSRHKSWANPSVSPRIQATYDRETNFGNPHAVYYNRKTADALQAVGFLAIRDEQNPLLKISEPFLSPLKK